MRTGADVQGRDERGALASAGLFIEEPPNPVFCPKGPSSFQEECCQAVLYALLRVLSFFIFTTTLSVRAVFAPLRSGGGGPAKLFMLKFDVR